MSSMFVKVLLDSSGSMLVNQSITVRGLNEYLHTLDRDATVSVARFASPYGVKRIHTNVKPQFAAITVEDYPCLGGTPLYDAVGITIQEIDTEAKEFDRVVLVIQTDGAENESKEFTRAQVKQLLTDKQQGEGWLVVFLGASLDAMAEAAHMGILDGHAAMYATANTQRAFAATARSTATYGQASNRNEGVQAANFTQAERDKLK